MEQSIKHKKTIKSYLYGIAFIVGLFSVCTLSGSAGNFFSPQEFKQSSETIKNCHSSASFRHTTALVLGNNNINKYLLFPGMGDCDLGVYKDNVYSLFPPGLPILALPGFIFGSLIDAGQVGAYATLSLLHVFTCLLIFLICIPYCKQKITALLASLFYGIASIGLTYSSNFFQHTGSVFCFTLILFFILQLKTKRISGVSNDFVIYLIGLIAGLSVWIDYPNLILVLPLLGYLFLEKDILQKRNVLIGFLGISIPLISLGAYNYMIFDSPLRIAQSLPSYYLSITETFQKNRHFFENQYSDVFRSFHIEHILKGLYILLISDSRSIFIFFPISFFAVLLFINKKSFKNQSDIIRIAGICILTNLLLYSFFSNPEGGASFGPRYLIPTMPFISILGALWIEKFLTKKNFMLILFVILLSSAQTLSSAVGRITYFPDEDIGCRVINVIIKNACYLSDNTKSASLVYNMLLDKFGIGLIYYFLFFLILQLWIFTQILIRIYKSNEKPRPRDGRTEL